MNAVFHACDVYPPIPLSAFSNSFRSLPIILLRDSADSFCNVTLRFLSYTPIPVVPLSNISYADSVSSLIILSPPSDPIIAPITVPRPGAIAVPISAPTNPPPRDPPPPAIALVPALASPELNP